jgi:hypothetical protein
VDAAGQPIAWDDRNVTGSGKVMSSALLPLMYR